jgi:hypothetical protein
LDHDNSGYLKAYIKNNSYGWYGSELSGNDIERWVGNFRKPHGADEGFDPQECAHFLLSSVIFYQQKHCKAIINGIVSKIKSTLHQELEWHEGKRVSEQAYSQAWNAYVKKCLVLPAAKQDDEGSSAQQAVRMWRNTDIDTGSVVELKRALDEDNKRHIFFVDDFIGTGSRMSGFLSDNLFPQKAGYGFLTIRELIEQYSGSVDFNIAVFALHTQGQSRLNTEFPQIKLYSGDEYDEQYNILAEDCVLYEAFKRDRASIMAYISSKQEELHPDNPYKLNLPVVFNDGCPNNTLSLYYCEKPSWAKLFPLGHPIKEGDE